jgi:hypothetical protein
MCFLFFFGEPLTRKARSIQFAQPKAVAFGRKPYAAKQGAYAFLIDKKVSDRLRELSSFSTLAASILRSPPYDKSTSNLLRLFVYPLSQLEIHHKEGYGSIGIARPKAIAFGRRIYAAEQDAYAFLIDKKISL